MKLDTIIVLKNNLSILKIAIILFILLQYSTANKNSDYRLWCYTGLKYFIGQNVMQDNQECSSTFGFQKYCYRFVAKTIVQDIIKIGCSATLCAGIRNNCADIEFQGVKGRICCCNTNNYCNFENRNKFSLVNIAAGIGLIFISKLINLF